VQNFLIHEQENEVTGQATPLQTHAGTATKRKTKRPWGATGIWVRWRSAPTDRAGIGSAMLADFCARVDSYDVLSYLETDNRKSTLL
jgi:hypothetical protein